MHPIGVGAGGSGSVFVVVPAYNEAHRIGGVLSELVCRFPNVIVVDDGSSDETGRAAAGHGAWVLRHVVNLGQGAALQSGTEFALRRGASVLVHFDADGQHRPDQVDALMAPILAGTADVVFGTRFARTAPENGRVPLLKRRVLLPAARLVNWVFTGMYLTDAHNGFRAMNRRVAEAMDLRQNRMAHATEIVQLTRKHHFRFAEVPVTVDYHEFGQGLVGGIRIVRDLILKTIFP